MDVRNIDRVSDATELNALTGFRFLAALYVFLFHVQIRWPLTESGPVSNVLSQGAVGMTMFFMLSGFILAHRYTNTKFDAIDYLWNRISRIVPVYLVAAFLALPYLAYQLVHSDPKFGLVAVIAQAASLIVADLLMVQAWIPMMFGYWNNNASWSLSVEAFFYVMFIPIAGLLPFLNKKWATAGCGLAYLLAILPGFAYFAFRGESPLLDSGGGGLAVFYAMPIFRLAEFVLGIAAYLIYSRMGKNVEASITRAAAFLCLSSVAYLATIGAKAPTYILHHWIIIPAVACSLIALASGAGVIAALLGSKPMVWLGKISYCFYSFQFHVLLFIGYVAPKLGLTSAEKLVISFGLLIAASAAGYYFIEEPLRRALRRVGPRFFLYGENLRSA